MDDDEQVDVAASIFGFLKGLPDTIKTEILLFVTMYGCDVGSMEVDEMWSTLEDALLKTGGMKRFGAVLRVKAAIDFVLMRSLTIVHRNQASPPIISPHLQPSEAVNRSLEMMRLRGPLLVRHTEDAVAKWNTFCSQHMSEQDLMRYEDRLMRL